MNLHDCFPFSLLPGPHLTGPMATRAGHAVAAASSVSLCAGTPRAWRLLGLCLSTLSLLLAGCSSVVPTPLPPVPPATFPSAALPTLTPPSLSEPALLELKQTLKRGLETKDSTLLADTISFSKWAASIYRQGGTPPVDPRRGLNLTLEFAKENRLVVDLTRPTYEPVWSVPAGDTSVLVRVTPLNGRDPYYAHVYLLREPGAWRFTGILTRIPYYDAPTIAQLRADPSGFAGKEFMYVGAFRPVTDAPPGLGAAPPGAAFILDTFAGPIWVALKQAPYVSPLPPDVPSREGELVRVFGIVTRADGTLYLNSDSVQFLPAGSWAHARGVITRVDPGSLRVIVAPEGGGASSLQLTLTTLISLPDATRGMFSSLQSGQTVDATGVPQNDGTLLTEELFLSP